MEVDVERTGGELSPAEVDADGDPNPTFSVSGSVSTDETVTVLTDRNGVVTFRLARPTDRNNREDDRLDEVTFSTDLGDVSISQPVGVAWSKTDPVLVQALPTIDSYRFRTRDEVRLNVFYRLYDQYGNTMSSTTGGRADTELKAMLSYELYEVDINGKASVTDAILDQVEDVSVRSGRITKSLTVTIPSDSLDEDHVLVVTPKIFSDHTSGTDVFYARLGVPVWVVKYADDGDVPPSSTFLLTGDIDDINRQDMIPELQEVEMYPGSNEFRTFFTMWEYDSNDRFIFDDDDDENVTLQEFEELFANRVDTLADIYVRLYYDREARESVFEITPID